MWEILGYQFFRHALWASALTAIVCGIIGAYIVVRRIVFVSGGITHASFGGLGLGVYLGINPILSAGVAATLSALVVGGLSRGRGAMREDSAIAAVWSVGMALGVIFLMLTPGYTTSLSSYLFGNILLVGRADLVMLGACALLLVGVFARWYRPILYSMFDPDFAETRGMRAGLCNTLMLVLVAISLVLSIRLVGIMLLMSLLSLPQSIASLLTADFRRLMLYSVLISMGASVVGLYLSYLLSLPTGAVIILLLFALFLGVRLYLALRPRSGR